MARHHPYAVSIPYRQATGLIRKRMEKDENLFQFLIGRLQAGIYWVLIEMLRDVSIPYRQATGIRTTITMDEKLQFQFLIGRLQACG